MEDQKNENFFKNGKNNVNNFKSVHANKLCHDTIFSFLPNNGVL